MPPPPSSQRGQATVELVAVVPLVVLLLALAWQLAVVGQTAWAAHAAARAAARAHAVGGDELRAARATLPPHLDRRLTVLEARGDEVGVRVRVPILVPGVRDASLTARSAFKAQG
jgi:ApbE superfamily uncharacterized protein (UPF0280 family)